MKLRNKKTGEIADLSEGLIRDTYNGEMIQIKPVAISNKQGYVYGSLAELNEEWEDYAEPKKYWTLDGYGEIMELYDGELSDEKTERDKEIGNYFETNEEAEQAVEKLKAWKRLKDKGFEFNGWSAGLGKNKIYTIFWSHNDGEFDLRKDLDLLFGGEE